MAERSAVEELDALLDDAPDVFRDSARFAGGSARFAGGSARFAGGSARFVIAPDELRAGARRRIAVLEPELPKFRQRMNRGLFTPLAASLVGLFHALREDAGLDRAAAAAVIDEVLQTAYRRRLQPPIKGKLMGAAFRLPVLRNAILRSMERASEDPGGFVMRKVDSPGDLMAFDVAYCPISKFFAEHDAVEVGPLVCKIDDMLAGIMPGITLHRTGTIANGASRCDFRYRREG
jgi:hypothetical protein